MNDHTAANTTKVQLVSSKAVALLLDVSERTVWRWLSAGKIITPVRIGNGTTRWRREDLDEWMAAGCPEHFGDQD